MSSWTSSIVKNIKKKSTNTFVKKKHLHNEIYDWNKRMPLLKFLLVDVFGNFAYWSFSQPYQWNRKTYFINTVTSKLHHIIRIIFTLLVTLSTVSQLYVLARDIPTEKLKFNEFTTLAKVIGAIFCTITTFFQIHTALRIYEVKEFSNLSMNYLSLMIKHNIIDSTKKFDRFCAVLLSIFSIYICGVGLAGIVVFYINCEGHVLSGVLPICNSETLENGQIIHKHGSVFSIFFYSMILIFISIQHGYSSLSYFAMLTIPILGCDKVLSKMKDSNILDNTDDIWLLHYRILQMLFCRFNICVGKYIVTVGLFCMILMIVVLNYLFITVTFQPSMLFGVFIYICVITFFIIIVQQGVSFPEISIEIVEERKSKCFSTIEYFALQLKTCRPLHIRAAGFFYVTKDIMMETLDITLNYTVELLLSFE